MAQWEITQGIRQKKKTPLNTYSCVYTYMYLYVILYIDTIYM